MAGGLLVCHALCVKTTRQNNVKDTAGRLQSDVPNAKMENSLMTTQKENQQAGNDPSLFILYTNYRGETRWREIIPLSVKFGNNEWHKEQQWLLCAIDVEKQQGRSFAMRDILKISKYHPTTQPKPTSGEWRVVEGYTGDGLRCYFIEGTPAEITVKGYPPEVLKQLASQIVEAVNENQKLKSVLKRNNDLYQISLEEREQLRAQLSEAQEARDKAERFVAQARTTMPDAANYIEQLLNQNEKGQ